ncbi:MAG: hypothetical protein KAR80_03420 [Rhodospirillaceae bacterium]|nr:hypothetical protein [Rhodospirillaceae bacterium]
MGKLECERDVCFYNSGGKCTNIAVSVTVKCELFLDLNGKKEWSPTSLVRPNMDAQGPRQK